MGLGAIIKQRIPRERLRAVLDRPGLATNCRRPFLPIGKTETNRFRVGISTRAIDQLEHVLLLRRRVADRILGLREGDRRRCGCANQNESDETKPQFGTHALQVGFSAWRKKAANSARRLPPPRCPTCYSLHEPSPCKTHRCPSKILPAHPRTR